MNGTNLPLPRFAARAHSSTRLPTSPMWTRCIDASKKMLHVLEHLVSDSEEGFNGYVSPVERNTTVLAVVLTQASIIWQLVCGPFVPFLLLHSVILLNGKGGSEENQEALAAMERLPVFLKEMSIRNSLARKLEKVAVVFVKQARVAVPSVTSGTVPHLMLASRNPLIVLLQTLFRQTRRRSPSAMTVQRPSPILSRHGLLTTTAISTGTLSTPTPLLACCPV
jgi:hypothetical protein